MKCRAGGSSSQLRQQPLRLLLRQSASNHRLRHSLLCLVVKQAQNLGYQKVATDRLLSKSLTYAFFVGAISAGLIQIKEAHAIRINEGIKHQRIAGTYYAPAISSEVSWGAGKSVRVASPSPQIEKSPTALYVQDILWRECWMLQMRSLAASTKHFWPQHARTGWSIWVNLIEVELGWDWHIAKKAVCVNLQSLSRRFPTIVPNRTNAPIKMSG